MTSDLGLQGLVLYCATSGCHPLHSQALRVYEAAEQLALPVFFHGPGDGEQQSMLSYAQPYFIDEVAVTFPDLKIIIGNMGRPFLEQTLAVIAKNQHVYADLSIRPSKVWQTYNTVVAAHERGVMDKLLFGSAFPVENANVCIEALLGFNMLLADTNLPTVPRGTIRDVIERHALDILQIENNIKPRQERDRTCTEINEKA
jgi:predicted TIM-barrel fold metal-dependent hydrolase